MTPTTRYTLYVLIAATAGAVGLVITEIALRFYSVTALFIALVSNLIGGILLLAPTFIRGETPWRGWPAADWLRLLVSSLAIYALGFLLLYSAISHIGAGKASLLGRLEAIFIIVLAVLFLGERWSTRHWVASLLALGGAVVASFNPAAWNLSLGLGELISILTAFVFSAGIVILKPLLDRHNGQFITGIGLLVGALLLGGVMVFTPGASLNEMWGGLGWMALLALGGRGVCLGVSWATYNIAMRHLGASRCAVIFLSMVFITVALQLVGNALAPDLGLQVPENLWMTLMGGCLICAAIVLLHRQAQQGT